MIFKGFSAGSAGETTAVVILDRVTQWIDCFPCITKDTEDTRDALQQFVGLTPAKWVYSDNSQEIRKAVAQLGLCIPVLLPIDLRLMESLSERFDPCWMAPVVSFFMRDCLTGTGLMHVGIFVS